MCRLTWVASSKAGITKFDTEIERFSKGFRLNHRNSETGAIISWCGLDTRPKKIRQDGPLTRSLVSPSVSDPPVPWTSNPSRKEEKRKEKKNKNPVCAIPPSPIHDESPPVPTLIHGQITREITPQDVLANNKEVTPRAAKLKKKKKKKEKIPREPPSQQPRNRNKKWRS